MSQSDDQPTPQAALITPNYAPASLDLPWYRHQGFRRLAVIAIVLVVASCVAYVYRYVPHYWRIGRLQNKCLDYNVPPDQVVYSELPADIAKLPATSQEYWLDLSPRPPVVLRRPDCWVEFDSAISGSAPVYPVLFLGERSNGRQRQLVCVLFKGWGNDLRFPRQATPDVYATGEPRFEIQSYEIVRYNGFSQTRWASGTVAVTQTAPSPVNNIRFFAGQRDPKDSSRFTIDYEADGQRGVIEGRLESNTSVTVRIKDGPLKQALPK
jgi:hypothetical protein